MTRNIRYAFRWPLKQIAPEAIEVNIPLGEHPILNPDGIAGLGLSDKELELAEDAALRSIALVQ